MRKWKLGVSAAEFAAPSAPLPLRGPVTDCLRTAAKLGYDAIEVHTRENADLDLPAIQQAMEETGVRIAQIVTGKLCTEGGCSLIDDRPYAESACV